MDPNAFVLFDLTIFDCWLNHLQNAAEEKVKFSVEHDQKQTSISFEETNYI